MEADAYVDDVVHGLVICGYAANGGVHIEGNPSQLRVRTGAEVAQASLVTGEQTARPSEVEALRHREADEVVAHLHDRRGMRGDREGEHQEEHREEGRR